MKKLTFLASLMILMGAAIAWIYVIYIPTNEAKISIEKQYKINQHKILNKLDVDYRIEQEISKLLTSDMPYMRTSGYYNDKIVYWESFNLTDDDEINCINKYDYYYGAVEAILLIIKLEESNCK